MRAFTKYGGCLFLAMLFMANLVQAQDSVQVKGPEIFVAEKTYDFGSVPADTIISHIFVIQNTGSDSLRIYRLKSG